MLQLEPVGKLLQEASRLGYGVLDLGGRQGEVLSDQAPVS